MVLKMDWSKNWKKRKKEKKDVRFGSPFLPVETKVINIEMLFL